MKFRHWLFSAALLVAPLAIAIGCLVPLPDGSGILLGVEHLPKENMPAPPINKPIPVEPDKALDIGELAANAVDPVLGALLYQFVFRPLRKKYGKKE